MKLRDKVMKIVALFAAALIISGCGGAEQRKVKYMTKSKAYFEQQNYEKARIELRNALQIDPKFSEAYLLSGQIAEKEESWNKAFGNYVKALELDPGYVDAMGRLGRLYLLSGDTDKATELVDKLLAKEPNNITGKTLRIGIISKKGNVKEAFQKAEELMAANPSSSEVADLLASLAIATGNLDRAEEALKAGITANPKNIQFHVTLARIYNDKKEYEKAEQLIQEVIRIEPEKLQYRVLLATLYAQWNQIDKAEKTLRDSIQADPNDANRYLLIAEFLATRKGLAPAEAELQAAIKTNPKLYKLRFGLSRLYEQIGAADKVAAVYRDIIDLDSAGASGLSARVKLADLMLKEGQQAEPERLVNEVLKENPRDNDALILRAKLAMLQGNAQGAIASLRAVLGDQPASIEVLTLLADAHLMNKDDALAKENLSKVIELNPQNPKARLPLAQFLAKSGDYDGALKKIDEALKIAPKDMEVLLAKTKIHAAKRDLKGVQASLMRVKEAQPNNPVGYYQMGQVYAAQKKYDDAIREFEQAMKRSTDTYQYLSAIISANLAEGKPEKAIKRLTGMIKDAPSHPFAHEALAEVYITRKQYADAEKELHEAIKANPKWNVPYRNLANLYLVQKDFAAAEQTYRQGLGAIPEDPELLLHLAVSYERTRDYSKAIETYERIVLKKPSFEIAVNNLASLLTDSKGDASSLKRAKTLAQRFEASSEPAFRDTLGWVYYKSGEADKAVAILKDVVKQAPATPVFRYHLGMAYYKQGNVAEAKVNLAKAVEAKNDFSGVDEARSTLKQIP